MDTGNTFDFILNSEENDENFDIDFILAYNSQDDDDDEKFDKRKVFESNLMGEGLQLEYDRAQQIHFIKIRAPKAVVLRYAETLKFKFPLIPLPNQELIYEKGLTWINKLTRCTCFSKRKYERLEPKILFEFSKRHKMLYDLYDPRFYNAGVRNRIVFSILQRQHFVANYKTPLNMGIEKLLQDGVYQRAYPLHNDSHRKLLLEKWASVKKCLHLQPLYAVNQYFGSKVTIYFAWLGFYVIMLIPLSVLGVLSFFYGLVTMSADRISNDICYPNKTILMCPQCDKNCDYWELKNTCVYAKILHLLDNDVSVLFALSLSLWSVLYLELWKQYSSGLVHMWGLTGYSHQVEHPRPQYLSKLYQKRKLAVALNAVNHAYEPVVPFWRLKFLPSFTSYSILVLFVCISIAVIFALIVYRMAQIAAQSYLDDNDSRASASIMLPITTALLDLVVITLLSLMYARVATVLTNIEYHRTQSEYEDSLTVKNYIFEFINYYSSLFYIAFFKNKFIGYPGEYIRLFGFRQEECHSAGCLMELCLQLVIIMVGKQVIRGVYEFLYPYVMTALRNYCKKSARVIISNTNPWTRDYNLEPFTSDTLYGEYIKMVIQFGFVVLFSLAFPLAPFLALLNNVIELRLDAIKFLKFMQRPIARRQNSIGVWYNIMQILTSISVIVNAIIIAFSTNLIPKFVYKMQKGDGNLDGFLDFTLATFNTKDFEVVPDIKKSRYQNVEQCQYFDYRNPAEHAQPYGHPVYYWHIWIGRLAFIVLYQTIITFLQVVVAWVVPDIPPKLLRRIQREDYFAREYILNMKKDK